MIVTAAVMRGDATNPRGWRDRGAADALALVLIAPVAIGLAVLVASLGKTIDARAQVQSAAESAAQAAALERTPGAAVAAAGVVVDAMLATSDTCAEPLLDVDTTRFVAGGSVRVTVSCTVPRAGIEVIEGQPLGATALATIDEFRAGQP